MILHSRVLFGDIRHFSGYIKSLNMSSRRHKLQKRSPSSHEGSLPKRHKDEDDSLHKILQSIESLSSRANQPETITDTDDDALSIMAGETPGLEISVPLATEASFKTATVPIRAPVGPIKAPTESRKTSDKAENSANSNDDHGLFDPVAKSTSWKPTTSFSKFLLIFGENYLTSNLWLSWMTGQLLKWMHSLLQN